MVMGSESESGFIAKQVYTYKEFAVVCLCNHGACIQTTKAESNQ